MFRMREFTIAEIEYFIHPDNNHCNLLTDEHKKIKLRLLNAKNQELNKNDLIEITINGMIKNDMLDNWHAYWLSEQILWLKKIGLNEKKLKIREHMKNELSHYSKATFDIDYEFSFGSKEIAGNADRGQYDLNQHMNESKEKLEIFDEETKKKIIPRVIEPTFGMDRIFMAIITEAYNNDKDRGNIVLKLNSNIAPIQIGVFPLVNKLNDKTKEIFNNLKKCYSCIYDKSGSIGRRYARADELGIPFCITIDFETLEDNCVTIRDRNTTKQERISIKEVNNYLFNKIY
jgi:glycyl-tRNA synthetase